MMIAAGHPSLKRGAQFMNAGPKSWQGPSKHSDIRSQYELGPQPNGTTSVPSLSRFSRRPGDPDLQFSTTSEHSDSTMGRLCFLAHASYLTHIISICLSW